MTEVFPPEGRIAAIDYGEVRIGIAVSDPSRTIASPLETYTRRNERADAERFRRLVEQERIVGFVVGLPVHVSGDESPKSKESRKFGQWLAQVTGIPVCFHDERYSSLDAERLLGEARLTAKRRKRRRDMLAAQIILSSFLDLRTDHGGEPASLEDGPDF